MQWVLLPALLRLARVGAIGVASVTFVTAAVPVRAQQVEVQVASGAEADTNPSRVVGTPTATDVASRSFVSLDVAWREPAQQRWFLQADGAAAGRALASSSADDSLVSDGNLRLSRSTRRGHVLYLAGAFRDRTERVHFRDYRRVGGALGAVVRGAVADVRVDASMTSLVFKPNPALNWIGPGLAVTPTWYISELLVARFGATTQIRRLDDAAAASGSWGITDVAVTMNASLEVSTPAVLAALGYSIQRNRSSAPGRSFLRHAPFAEATTMPTSRLLLRGRAVAQLSRFDDSAFVDETFLIDDDNRTQFSIAAEYTLGGRGVFLDARSTMYLDRFSGDGVSSFRRYLVYGGIGWRWRSGR